MHAFPTRSIVREPVLPMRRGGVRSGSAGPWIQLAGRNCFGAAGMEVRAEGGLLSSAPDAACGHSCRQYAEA